MGRFELISFVTRHYINFYNKNNYIPKMFNPYNESEIKDIAPTMSTQCGSTTSSATVLILEGRMNIEGQSGLIQPVDRKYKEHGVEREEHIEFKDDNVSHALRTSVIPLTAVKEYSNFYVLPRAKDGELINGSYNRVWKDEKIVGAINTTKIQEIGSESLEQLRIRKLTPKECWRLMGFSDESFEKAQSVNSNTQLYKQAGNSIVVDVLEKIINNLHLELEHIKLLELFGGIGACSEAMGNLGLDYEIVDYVEIDKYACASYNAMHGTEFLPQDIQEWDKDVDVTFIMHGSPCQDFSVAGKQAGGDEGSGTRSSLMYETVRIVEKLRPKYVLWENVKNVVGKKHRHNFDNYLERMSELGYTNHYQVLNAKDYGVPQNRERVFTLSILGDDEFEFPPKEELKIKLKDVLEDKVDEKYYLSQAMVNYMTGVNQKPSKFPRGERFTSNINRKNQDIGNAVTTNAGNRPTDNFVVEKEKWSDLD